MKKTLLIVLLAYSATCVAQKEFDVRNSYWGMTKAEVISAEYPLKPSASGDDIKYTNVELDYGLTANIYFKFKNELLEEITYAIYGPENNQGTCENIIPLLQKVNSIIWIIKILEEKNYICATGWGILNKASLNWITGKDTDMYNCTTNRQIIDIMDDEAKKAEGENVIFTLKNDRTNVTFKFNEFQNVVEDMQERNKLYGIECNDEMYNLMLWLTYEPNINLKYDNLKSKF